MENGSWSASTVTGTCFGIPAGTHTIQVYVGPLPGQSSSFSAWTARDGGYWSIEAEEVR